MSSPAIDVVEFLLTAHIYTNERGLDENDLPPRYRQVFWSDGTIERPLTTTETTVRKATGVEHPWEAVSDLLAGHGLREIVTRKHAACGRRRLPRRQQQPSTNARSHYRAVLRRRSPG